MQSKPYYKLFKFRGSEISQAEEQLNRFKDEGYLITGQVPAPEGVIVFLEHAPELSLSVDEALEELAEATGAETQLPLLEDPTAKPKRNGSKRG